MPQYDPFDLIGHEADHAAREERAEWRRQIAENDFRWLMDSQTGRRIVWGILETTGLFQSSYTGNNDTFFREGQRNIGLILMAKINEYCPAHYSKMVEENGRRTPERDPSGSGTDPGQPRNKLDF